MGDYKSVDYVLGQLRREHDKPFFLACGIYRPHLPWYVPRKYFDLFPEDDVQLPKTHESDLDDLGDRARDIAGRGGHYHRHVLEAGQWRQAVRGYLASVAFADAMLGRLLDGLDASPYRRNTIVLLWSDHGWQLGEKTHWRKFALWDNVARSVLMIHAPRETPGLPEGSRDGEMCRRVVSLQDIYPTLIDLCGLPANKNIDGRSLAPLLRDPAAPWNHVALTTYDYDEFSVRSERFRYIRYIDGSEELYDHDADPEEWNNLAADPKFEQFKSELASRIPPDAAPLVKTSEKLQPHHIPPFRSRDDYEEWLRHGKDNQHLIRKYWQWGSSGYLLLLRRLLDHVFLILLAEGRELEVHGAAVFKLHADLAGLGSKATKRASIDFDLSALRKVWRSPAGDSGRRLSEVVASELWRSIPWTGSLGVEML